MSIPVTPLEISEYKRNWAINGYPVRLHSDLDIQGKDWCRRHLERYQWSFSKFTNVYEHTFNFEREDDAIAFKAQFIQWTDLEPV